MKKSNAHPVATDDFTSVEIQTHEVSCCHEAKVTTQRVHPDGIGELRISYTDVATHTLCEAFACKVAEHSGHMNEDVLALKRRSREGWNAWGR